VIILHVVIGSRDRGEGRGGNTYLRMTDGRLSSTTSASGILLCIGMESSSASSSSVHDGVPDVKGFWALALTGQPFQSWYVSNEWCPSSGDVYRRRGG